MRILPVFLLASTLTLGACSWVGIETAPDETAPPPPEAAASEAAKPPAYSYAGCPKVELIKELTIYQHPPQATDATLVINTRMGKLQSKCGSTTDGFLVDGRFDILALRGAASASKLANLPFFVSVVNEKEEILQRDIYDIPITFEDGKPTVRMTIPFSVPVPKASETGALPRVFIGFHLGQEQLEANTKLFNAAP